MQKHVACGESGEGKQHGEGTLVTHQREDAAEGFLDGVMEIPREIRQYLFNRQPMGILIARVGVWFQYDTILSYL